MALLSILSTVPPAAAQRSADASPLTVMSVPKGGAEVTSTPLMASITGALGEPNAQGVTNLSFTPNSVVETIQNGFTGVNASWKSNSDFSQTMNIWFVVANSKNQFVFLSFAQLLFGARESKAVFQTFSSALPSGTYTVQTFVLTPSGVSFSQAISVTISF